MTTDLKTQLRAFADELASDLPEVEMADALDAEPVRSLQRPRRRRSTLTPAPAGGRRWMVAAAAGVVVLLVAAPILFFRDETPNVGDTPGETAETASIPPVTGLPGLPPPDAVPSSPQEGELVASMWEHHGAPTDFGNGWIYIYADGRVIWAQLDDASTGGWLEQRLTRTAVELIRSEMLATGLFEEDQPARRPDTRTQRFVFGSIQVRNGDRLVYVGRSVADLFERVATIWDWLPADAWVDQAAKPFVPSHYAACAHSDGYVEPDDPLEALSVLPSTARDFLLGAPIVRVADLAQMDPGGFTWLEGSGESCFLLTTDEARTLDSIMERAGLEKFPQRPYDGSDVGYPITSNGNVTLGVWPMLPHGVPAFTGA